MEKKSHIHNEKQLIVAFSLFQIIVCQKYVYFFRLSSTLFGSIMYFHSTNPKRRGRQKKMTEIQCKTLLCRSFPISCLRISFLFTSDNKFVLQIICVLLWFFFILIRSFCCTAVTVATLYVLFFFYWDFFYVNRIK